MHVVWPDVLIAAIALLGLLKGFKRGFVRELSGAVALAASLITPWFYNGAFDGFFAKQLHLSAGSAHVVAMIAVGIATYLAVMIAARMLDVVARLPVIGFGNALGGAAVGLLKAAVAIWVVLYVALFFPLSPSIRGDLHRSMLVSALTQPNARVDAALIGTLPGFARPLVDPVFARHRV